MRLLLFALSLIISSSTCDAQVFKRDKETRETEQRTQDAQIFKRGEARTGGGEVRFVLRIGETSEAIENAVILDQRGNPIRFRITLDRTLGLILGTTVEGLEFEVTRTFRDDGERYIITGYKDGELYKLRQEDLYLTDRRFREQCFGLSGALHENTPLHVGIALDMSGSMKDHLNEVTDSLISFVDLLPEKSLCRVRVFSDSGWYVTPSGNSILSDQNSQLFDCSMFGDKTVFDRVWQNSVHGGTSIVKGLEPIYLEAVGETESYNLAIIISDGDGSSFGWSNLVSARDAAVKYSEIYTIVNWLCSYNTSYPLSDLADMSVFGQPSGQRIGTDFFRKVYSRLDGQRELKLSTCEKN